MQQYIYPSVKSYADSILKSAYSSFKKTLLLSDITAVFPMCSGFVGLMIYDVLFVTVRQLPCQRGWKDAE